MTNKLANVMKVKALMAKGMSAKEAVKAAYPDWSDEKVSALAAKMGGGEEKTAMIGNSPLAQEMNRGSKLPGYSKGGPVKKDGFLTDMKGKPYARVHKGEKVVPADHDCSKASKSKEAKLRVHNIEDEIGDYLSDKDEARVRQMITKAKKKSFAMRHPILTGIPTLGIAPAMANNKAKQKIIRQLAKSDPKLRKQLRKMRETKRKEQHEREVARLGATKVNVTQLRDAADSKTASVDFAVGIRIASDTLYKSYMDKTAVSSMTLAGLGKLLSGAATKAAPYASKAWSGAKGTGRAVAEGIEGGARAGRDSLLKAFPEQGKQFAAFLEKNPEVARTLSSAKKNWRPLAGGAALGGTLLS